MVSFAAISYSVSDSLTTIGVLRRQEDAIYKKHDSVYNCPENDIDDECRTKMAAWCCQVIDFCQMSRETVEIALSHIDRFVATEHGRAVAQDRALYQLATMAAIYTAIKINESRVISPDLLSMLSQRMYSASQIEEMEFKILHALRWYVNPPTCLTFVQHYLNVLPSDVIDDHSKDAAFDLCKMQVESFVAQTIFSNLNASTVAYCSLVNSLESMGIALSVISWIELLLKPTMTDYDSEIDNVAHNDFSVETNYIRQQLHAAIGGLKDYRQYPSSSMKGRTQSYNSIVDMGRSSLSTPEQIEIR